MLISTTFGPRVVLTATLLLGVTVSSFDAFADCVGNNTCFGEGALQSNTTGMDNSAYGYQALFSNTEGGGNAAVGRLALFDNISGNANVAVGERALFHNTIGDFNTALGSLALAGNTTGMVNTAVGLAALSGNTTGSGNTAIGQSSMNNNFTGSGNTAVGDNALGVNWDGSNNTAVGAQSLLNTRGGDRNTAVGTYALRFSTGSGNIALGYQAGVDVEGGSNNINVGNRGRDSDSGAIRIGSSSRHTRAFVAGIFGVKPLRSDATSVFIDSRGQLGTVQSSIKVKEDVQPIAGASKRLFDLRPVAFRYREADEDGLKPVEFGLIAEEVAEVFPELVIQDASGQPVTVKYHLLSALLLNELQEQQRIAEEQSEKIRTLERQVSELANLHARLVRAADASASRSEL